MKSHVMGKLHWTVIDKINQNCEASSEFLNEIGTNEMRSNEVAKQRVDSLKFLIHGLALRP